MIPISEPASVLSFSRISLPDVKIATQENCTQRYRGKLAGISAQQALDIAHFISAGSMSFARGLNDTPKIVALLLIIEGLGIRWGMLAVAGGMAIGGLLNAKKVAITMSQKITRLNHGQGFTSNLVTSLLVIFASRLGLPVSTTHVSVGSLFGIGLVTRQADIRVVVGIVLSWVLTLPVAAILAGGSYWLLLSFV
jgi:inorganic phosphate transporter, PiT family